MTTVESLLDGNYSDLLKVSGLSIEDVVRALEQQSARESQDQKLQLRRVDLRRSWSEVGRSLTDEEKSDLDHLTTVLGTADVSFEVETLSQEQKDRLVDEFIYLRKVEDIISGRKTSLRATALNAITAEKAEADEDQVEPEFEPGEIFSSTSGMKLSKTIQGGKTQANWDKLAEVLSTETWESVSNEVEVTTRVREPGEKRFKKSVQTYRVVNEEAVLRAIENETITLSDLRDIAVQGKKIIKLQAKAMSASEIESLEKEKSE